MTDIQPPVSTERASNVHQIGAPVARPAESISTITQGQARIVYSYWIGAVAVGLIIWGAIFYFAF